MVLKTVNWCVILAVRILKGMMALVLVILNMNLNRKSGRCCFTEAVDGSQRQPF